MRRNFKRAGEVTRVEGHKAAFDEKVLLHICFALSMNGKFRFCPRAPAVCVARDVTDADLRSALVVIKPVARYGCMTS